MAHVLETSSLETMLISSRLSSIGIRAFVPVYTREVMHARRVEKRTYPLYGRYIFAWFEAHELRSVLKTRGVVGVLRRAGSDKPAEVSDALISAIGNVVASEEFRIDQEVVIRGGNWDGLQGLFCGRENDRITIMLSMLGRKVEKEFDASQVTRKPPQRNETRA